VIDLRSGAATLAAELPAGWNVTRLRIAPAPAERSEAGLVSAALDAPIDAPALESFVAAGDTVAVLVPDKTRLCRASLFLPMLLERMHAAGVMDDDLTIVFACGTHRGQREAEKRAILGDDVYHRYRVIEHDARDEGATVRMGTTRFGTDVRINRSVARASKVLSTGTIVHHYFAGYGGGPKMLLPGVAAYSSAVQNHRRCLTPGGSFHPACRDGNLAGNPVAEDLQDATRFYPPVYAFTALLDAGGRIAHALCGEPAETHRRGCALVDAMYRMPVAAAADCVLVSAGGAPKDVNFIQAHKALHRAQYIAKPGAPIICVAECADGIGNDRFLEWFDAADDNALREALATGYTMNAHTAVALRDKTRRHPIYFVSALPDDVVTRMGMLPSPTLAAAVAAVAGRLPARADVHVIDNGSLTVPYLQ
jgi:nickel-dependent lactate racemase